MKKIDIPNNFNDIELGNGNFIREYSSLNIEQELNIDTPILAVQKSTIETLDMIMERLGQKGNDSTALKEALGRSGFVKMISKEYGELGIVATKGADSTDTFAQISDFYLGGTDIGEKLIASGQDLQKISTILGEIIWNYKTELLFILGLNSLDRVVKNGSNLSNFEVDIIATKFSPILTKNAVEKLDSGMLKPKIDVVDSNSELAIQILEFENRTSVVGGVEIVQSGNSLIATNNAVVKNGKIILPGKRNMETGKLDGEVISELEPDSQIGIIGKNIETDVDLALYKILNDSNDKPKEFIRAIEGEMEKINKKI